MLSTRSFPGVSCRDFPRSGIDKDKALNEGRFFFMELHEQEVNAIFYIIQKKYL